MHSYFSFEISYIFEKYFCFFIFCAECGNENEKVFKEEESIEILKILGLIKNIYKYFQNTEEEVDEIRTYFLEEIKDNELTSKKNKRLVKLWIILNMYLF